MTDDDNDIDELDRELGWDEESRDSHLVMRSPVVGYLVLKGTYGTPESEHGMDMGVFTIPITQQDNRTGMGDDGDFFHDLPVEVNEVEEEVIGAFPATSEVYHVLESKPGECDWSFAGYEYTQPSPAVERITDTEADE